MRQLSCINCPTGNGCKKMQRTISQPNQPPFSRRWNSERAPPLIMRATDGSTYRIAVTVALDMYMSLKLSQSILNVLLCGEIKLLPWQGHAETCFDQERRCGCSKNNSWKAITRRVAWWSINGKSFCVLSSRSELSRVEQCKRDGSSTNKPLNFCLPRIWYKGTSVENSDWFAFN